MKVIIKVLGTLGKMCKVELNGNKAELSVPNGAAVKDVINLIGLPLDIAKINLINGRSAKFDSPVNDGDTISILPPIAGG